MGTSQYRHRDNRRKNSPTHKRTRCRNQQHSQGQTTPSHTQESQTPSETQPQIGRTGPTNRSITEIQETLEDDDEDGIRNPEPTDNQTPSRKRNPDEQQLNKTPPQQRRRMTVDEDTLEKLIRSNENVQNELRELKMAKSIASQYGQRNNDGASRASIATHRMVVEEDYYNPNGMATLAAPASHIDLRNLLWPHVPTEIIRAIAANTLEVTKLHLLIPPDYANRVIEVKERNHKDDDEDDADIRASRRLQRVIKQLPTKDHWMTALLMWGGIKAQLQPSMPHFRLCLNTHVVCVNKFTATHGWDQVLNYEIQFFQRYQARTDLNYVWALVGTQIQADYLIPKKNIGSSTSLSDNLCLKFQNQKDCSSNCRYQHRCTHDQTRCNGPHIAAHCPLNPNRIPPAARNLSNRISDGQRRGNNGYNPNFDPTK